MLKLALLYKMFLIEVEYIKCMFSLLVAAIQTKLSVHAKLFLSATVEA